MWKAAILFSYCLNKLKEVLDNGETALADEEKVDEWDQAGELINTIRKLKAHEDRLHDELW